MPSSEKEGKKKGKVGRAPPPQFPRAKCGEKRKKR